MDAADSAPLLAHAQPERCKADAELEAQIETAFRHMQAAQTPSLQRHYFARMRELIALRSPERIREMESARGLR